ncbi:hypothetical protein BDV59DRAFT_1629 [Aspergillus ambiguus]|uniref:uncharacterized protein n=1 Tax=Aspergillus ambiguus TaxID=176160 RepID=UPI003CCD9178
MVTGTNVAMSLGHVSHGRNPTQEEPSIAYMRTTYLLCPKQSQVCGWSALYATAICLGYLLSDGTGHPAIGIALVICVASHLAYRRSAGYEENTPERCTMHNDIIRSCRPVLTYTRSCLTSCHSSFTYIVNQCLTKWERKVWRVSLVYCDDHHGLNGAATCCLTLETACRSDYKRSTSKPENDTLCAIPLS